MVIQSGNTARFYSHESGHYMTHKGECQESTSAKVKRITGRSPFIINGKTERYAIKIADAITGADIATTIYQASQDGDVDELQYKTLTVIAGEKSKEMFGGVK